MNTIKQRCLYSILFSATFLSIAPILTVLSFGIYGQMVYHALEHWPKPMIEQVAFKGEEAWSFCACICITIQLVSLFAFPILVGIYKKFSTTPRIANRLIYLYAAGWLITMLSVLFDKQGFFAWWLD